MPERGRPLLLGHRGARGVRSIPENTFESFDRALADGCDGFEFDVRLTADGQAVICHDPHVHDIEIAKSTAAQVPQLPRLEDILWRYQQTAFLDIELKVGGLETIVQELLKKHLPRKGFVVSSFLPEVLIALASEDSEISLGLICETGRELLRWKELRIKYVIPHHKLATPALIRELKGAGKKIFVWTINGAAEMGRIRDLEVDGIISDDTDLLHRTMSRE